MPSVFRKRKASSSSGSAVATGKSAFAGDESLLQLHAETAELLRLVKSPTVARQRAPIKSRVTIEVLDDDNDDDDVNSGDGNGVDNNASGALSPPAPRSTATETPSKAASAPRTPADPFAFATEEARVRAARDTFYPDTTATKQALDRQQDALALERARLQRLARAEQAEEERKRQEIERHQRHKAPSRLDTSAVTIQAHARGFLCRRQQQPLLAQHHQQQLAARQQAEAEQWHEVRDVERGEVWYYNARTGSSGTNVLPVELPTIRTSSGYDASARSRPSSSSSSISVRAAPGAPKSAMKPSGSLPMLSSPLRQQHTSPTPLCPVISVANPWECDSVMGGSDESLCSQRTRDDFDDDESAIRRSTFDRRFEGDGDRDQRPHEQEDEAGDWQINDTLFLADGSRNSKLRDTIRNALYVSKFDSISTLIASNVVLRKKPARGRNSEAASSLTQGGNQRSVGKKSTSREIVLGKRDAPMFVAVLAGDERGKLQSPNARSHAKSPKSVTTKSKTRASGSTANMLTSPPRIRDLADPGFHDDLQPQSRRSDVDQGLERADSESSSAAQDPRKKLSHVCFNCWSSSNGRYCEVHRDPNESRKVKASESALMCANWDLDQLRRKHRAEEIQEVFLKQNASLRYDKKLKQYVTVVECKHPIYRAVDHLLASWNQTMRRKLHTRAWFRSFMEQLRAGRVPKADTKTPGLLKLKNTLQNSRWCTKYSNSVRAFHPTAPVTPKNQSGQAARIPDVIMIHPARPQQCHWVLTTEYTKPVELYRPRPYELPPRRCVPMPTPSYLEDIPLPVPNVFIDCGHVASWLERLCARISAAALSKAVLQVSACSPPRGFNEPRRTKHATPLTVMFATFGRKPTPGNVAVGGLSAELLIHMLVTTYVPAQFGNFIVFDRRAVAPSPTRDGDALFACLAIPAADPEYVFRALEHALNVRRPPCIVIAARAHALETEALALESRRFPLNRPEQTGEAQALGFRTFWLVDAFAVPDDVPSVLVQPNSDILSPNAPSMNATVTTKADRVYPFCLPTTKENTPIEFIHLLWIGQSSRNQPQVFTTLGAQQPGEFMKHSDPGGALGPCTTVVYRSWAFMQSSPVEEFATADGVAYWYDKQSGETFWTRPIVPAEKHRGKDGDVDGVVADGEGEVATLGVDAEAAAAYPQQAVRKYMTKSMEAPEEKDRRVRQVAASAKKHDIVVDLSNAGDDARGGQQPIVSPSRRALEKIDVPQLSFKSRESASAGRGRKGTTSGSRSHSPVKQQQQWSGSSTSEEHGARATGSGHITTTSSTSSSSSSGGSAQLDSNTKQLIESITQALGSVTGGGGGAGVDMLQLGIGLGMGLGLRAQQQQQGGASGNSGVVASSRTSSRSDRSRSQQTVRGVSVGGELVGHDEDDDDDDDDDNDDMSTSRSSDSTGSGGSLSVRSTMSTATSVVISLPPDELELAAVADGLGHSRVRPPGFMEKKPGYQTHAPPGEGSSWLSKPVDASGVSQTAVSGFAGAVHQRVACLPRDFVAAVSSTKTCMMQANYLPVIKNTNEPRSVGLVRPRGALQEWLPVGYSPWSAGRSVFGTQFISDLMQRPELVTQVTAGSGGGSAARIAASGARVEQREKVTQAVKESEQLEEIFSHCRHGKYDEVELDPMGNTLLSVACQNNNKRIAKLCMRRGADINTQNLNGQSVLHYCHEYGFHDLMDYLMDKGARDDLVNADGLTCYEGLNKEAVDAL
ncbi:hypothetical protein PybrP1_009307 [[Pythium] brassicae (nom. inval.)]|nr:hypothetical protein PybrP1_009307 [[Pythium] brassicae (nom. inval.)]